jgi:Heterokaryon incompatibility protein (HET)
MGLESKILQFLRRLERLLCFNFENTAHNYPYQPMDNARKDVRIVTIHPGRFDDPIECDLESVHLEEKFGTCSIQEALSYVWGDPKILLPITLGGQSVSITVNLKSALRHLRYNDKPRKMWIDALSINQADNVEKGHQVALMRQIYRRTSEVIVWLGTSKNGELAFEIFRELVADPNQHLDLALAPHLDERLMDRSHVEALLKIGDNELWRRMWIVQKCTMAQKLEFVRGTGSINGTTLLEALGHMTRHGRSCCSKLIHAKNDHPLRPFFSSDGNIKGRDFKDYREFFSTANIDLLDALGTYRLQRTHDDRDKIYGLLGLAMGPYEGFVEPDYTLPVEQVYERAALQFIRRTAKLGLLSHIVKDTDVSLPSWVPDWRTQMNHDRFNAH